MRVRVTLTACIVGAALAVAGCAGPALPSGHRVVAFDDDGLRLTLPAGWQTLRSGEPAAGAARTLFFLSNQPFAFDCVGDATSCLPIDRLEPGGVLVWWSTSRCAGPGCELPAGDRRLLSGREAVNAPPTGTCEAIHASSEDVYAVTVTPQRVDWIVVCTRAAGADGEAQLAAILGSIDWRTP